MSEKATFPYDTPLNVLFEPVEPIDVQVLVDANVHPWYNQTLTRVNDAVVRLGVIQGEYHCGSSHACAAAHSDPNGGGRGCCTDGGLA